MIVIVGERRYEHVNIEDLSLAHVMALQRELTLVNISSCKTWADVRALVDGYQQMKPAERGNHPEFLFLVSLYVWAARVTAGEQLELLEAVDVPLAQIRFVAEPHDKVEAADSGNLTARGPRKGSAPGGAGAGRKRKRAR